MPKKYTGTEFSRLKTRIKELLVAKHTHDEIANALNKEGFTLTNGSTIKKSNVSWFVRSNKSSFGGLTFPRIRTRNSVSKSGTVKKTNTTEAKTTKTVRSKKMLVAELLSSDITHAERVALVNVFFKD